MNHIVQKSVNIKGTPEQVWDALTNPEKTKEYFFNCRVYSSWQPESTITFKGKIFLIKNIELEGEIIDIIPQRLLKYTLQNSSDHAKTSTVSTVTEVLSYTNGYTRLAITDDVGFGSGAEKRYRRSEKGWDKVLKGLKKLVERESN